MPAWKLEEQEGRQIAVAEIEETKGGAGVATVKNLYIRQYAKEEVEQVESVKTIDVECERQPSVTAIVRKERSGMRSHKKAIHEWLKEVSRSTGKEDEKYGDMYGVRREYDYVTVKARM